MQLHAVRLLADISQELQYFLRGNAGAVWFVVQHRYVLTSICSSSAQDGSNSFARFSELPTEFTLLIRPL